MSDSRSDISEVVGLAKSDRLGSAQEELTMRSTTAQKPFARLDLTAANWDGQLLEDGIFISRPSSTRKGICSDSILRARSYNFENLCE